MNAHVGRPRSVEDDIEGPLYAAAQKVYPRSVDRTFIAN